MKKTISSLVTVALLSTAAFIYAEEKAPATQPAAPVNTKCPVMPEDDIDPKVTVEYEGKIIAFCCKICIKDFKKDPQKYVDKLK
jgi:YHS domain-containing protein